MTHRTRVSIIVAVVIAILAATCLFHGPCANSLKVGSMIVLAVIERVVVRRGW
jgi:hypothetical protein